MKKDSIVMIALACLAIGIGIGYVGSTRLPLVDKIEFNPRIELEFSKPVFWVIEKELPAPPPVIEEVEVVKEVVVKPRKFENTEELLEFIRWLKLNVPFQPFGDHRCGLDSDLVQQLAWAHGYNVNVDITENGRHLILNAVIEDGDVYTMYPPHYGIHKAGYIKGWHEYDENLWKEIVG